LKARWRERVMVWQESLGFTFWALERKSDRALLGFCGLKLADAPGGEAIAGLHEIGWRLREDCWGQGYAKEAAIASSTSRSSSSALRRSSPSPSPATPPAGG
jgi:RimJ/RimL family protein N-acetyltransferase